MQSSSPPNSIHRSSPVGARRWLGDYLDPRWQVVELRSDLLDERETALGRRFEALITAPAAVDPRAGVGFWA